MFVPNIKIYQFLIQIYQFLIQIYQFLIKFINFSFLFFLEEKIKKIKKMKKIRFFYGGCEVKHHRIVDTFDFWHCNHYKNIHQFLNSNLSISHQIYQFLTKFINFSFFSIFLARSSKKVFWMDISPTNREHYPRG